MKHTNSEVAARETVRHRKNGKPFRTTLAEWRRNDAPRAAGAVAGELPRANKWYHIAKELGRWSESRFASLRKARRAVLAYTICACEFNLERDERRHVVRISHRTLKHVSVHLPLDMFIRELALLSRGNMA